MAKYFTGIIYFIAVRFFEDKKWCYFKLSFSWRITIEL
jgi:hypothetical protein